MAGSQDYQTDPRNETVLVYLNGVVLPRSKAMVSIFDAGFSMGDGVWEGLRLHKGTLLFVDAHLDRLFEGARALALDVGLDRAGLKDALRRTLEANGMTDGVHVRLMVTRGLKATVSQDPRNALGRATIAIVAEYKVPPTTSAQQGLRLATVSVRCTPASMFDMRLNTHSRLNLITALLEAIEAGADEALMLDPHDCVSSCNATNFFFIRDGRVFTSAGDYCFNGITRGHVIALCHDNGVPIELGDFPVESARRADEAFVTGTTAGLTPVREIDGHAMNATPGSMTLRLQSLYLALQDAEADRMST
jgi:branched-chain amino acid aminotransferase